MPKLTPSDSVPISVANGETANLSSAADKREFSASEVMNWLHSPKHITDSPQKFLWVALAISLVLHLVMLLIPMPSEQKQALKKPEEKKVRVTQLPTIKKAGTIPPAAKGAPIPKKAPVLPKPTPPKSNIPPIPKLNPKPKPLQAATPKPVRPKPSIPPLEKPKPKAPPPKPEAPPPKATPTPDPTPKQEAPPPKETPAPEPPATEAPAGPDSWQDFPAYPSAESGCFNLPSCMATGKPLEEVSAFFEKELAAKKYTATPATTEAGRKVYQVTKNGRTEFLSLIFAEGKGTIYVRSPDQGLSLKDLAKAIEVPGEIENIAKSLGEVEDATCANFAQPNLFCESGTTQRPDIGIMKLVPGEAPDTFFDAFFRTNLVNNGYDPSEGQPYGGGPVYAVKKDTGVLYINLLPTQDGTGTIVVIWKTLPQ